LLGSWASPSSCSARRSPGGGGRRHEFGDTDGGGDAGHARYSNLGYLVLGQVIEAASASPYTDYVRTRILGPLGMISTDFTYRGELTAKAARGYHPRYGATTPLLRRIVRSGIFELTVQRLG
jgi:CubicO group peptidase (beta-lactamase class C family)